MSEGEAVRRWPRFETAACALIIAALAMRLVAFQYEYLASDATWYATMAESIRHHGEFLVPWSSSAPEYTQHFPPLYPLYLVLVFGMVGPTPAGLLLAPLLVAIAFALVTFLTTRDLYGRTPAFAVTALALVIPALVRSDREGLSETFVAMLFALTIWAILKSLERPAFVLLAGLFAGLSYLSKASMGPFFLLAGLAGFAWRFHYVRWNLFRDRHYLAAAALFLSFVLTWGWRNVARHGWPHWETQPYANRALETLFADPVWLIVLPTALVFTVVALALVVLPFMPNILGSLRDVRDQRTSALWLAVVVPIFVSVFFVAAFSHVEGWSIPKSEHVARYAITPIVPLLWLALRHLPSAKVDAAGTRKVSDANLRPILWTSAGVILFALVVGLDPRYYLNTPHRRLLVAAGAALAVAVLAIARLRSRPMLPRSGRNGRRAPTDTSGGHGVIIGSAALALAAPFLPTGWFAALLATAAAMLVESPRARVLAVVAILGAAGLQGVGGHVSVEQVADDLAAFAGPDDTVAVLAGHEPYLWPVLHERVGFVSTTDQPTFLVDLPADPWNAAPPEGYRLLKEYPIEEVHSPLSAISRFIERTVFGIHLEVELSAGARVFVRDAP